MPLFGCIILGLAGENPLARALGIRPLVFVGEASYCLYLLHFNFWNLIHDSHVLNRLGLTQFDPWISYVLLIAMALLALLLGGEAGAKATAQVDGRVARFDRIQKTGLMWCHACAKSRRKGETPWQTSLSQVGIAIPRQTR